MRGELIEPKLVITIMVVAIAALSWWVVMELTDKAALDQTYIANQVRHGVYAMLTSPYDQGLRLEFNEQKNYSIIITQDDTAYFVGVQSENLLSFSYKAKMNIPEGFTLAGVLTNFTRVCISRSNDLIEAVKC